MLNQSMATGEDITPTAPPQQQSLPATIPMQAASLDIWDKKYRLKTIEGVHVDQSIEETQERVARALANQESPEHQDYWYEQFLWALDNGAIPAGRIISNAGAQQYKPKTSTINCTVSQTIPDSMDRILQRVMDAGITLKAGCGIGYCFSTLRPRGAMVAGAGASTSGPVSFMGIYDKMCGTISSAGGRRGAQMATFDVAHPDVEIFIAAKRTDGNLRQFNLSLLITDAFIQAVKTDAQWPLVFPVLSCERDAVDLEDPEQVLWREWPITEGYIVSADGLVACRIYKKVKARHLWNRIMKSNFDFAEPGFILIDRANDLNNNWWCEYIQASNPCGEQLLPPGGSCLLGSINLTKFVSDPFTDQAKFDWERYGQVIRIFTRMLDNVVEISGLPLQIQREEIADKRRHGMGYLGLGSTMTMLGMTYGDPSSVDFTSEVTKVLAVEGWKTGLHLAKEKGPAPILAREFTVTPAMMRQRPELADHGYLVGSKIRGSELHARFSRYMQKVAQLEPELVEELATIGSRFTHHTSIAPTGTISLSLANNASNGIEPSFAHQYSRNIIREGKKTKEKVEVFSYELLAYRALVNQRATPSSTDIETALPAYFVSTDDIPPRDHIAIQAAAQQWIDSSISKTTNVATDIDFADFREIYMQGHAAGLKGCTTFRFNPEAFQGVLVKEQDLANTTYEFELEDGTKVQVKGDEQVEYDGELHDAANLYDALKEGVYASF